jgi:hypothetical protein
LDLDKPLVDVLLLRTQRTQLRFQRPDLGAHLRGLVPQ